MRLRKLLLLLLTLCFMTSAFSYTVHAAATKLPIENIYSCPGGDASTEAGLAWHATTDKCTLMYTEATDVGFTKATKAIVRGELSDVDYSEKDSLGKYYIFKYNITGLNPDTRYVYRIQCGSTVSKPHYFKTAGNGGTFNFMVMSDAHASTSSSGINWNGDVEGGALKKLVLKGEDLTKDTGGIDVVAWAGDFVRYGQTYANWQLYNDSYLTTNYSVAVTMGNHEYYTSSHDSTNKMYWTDSMLNTPDNSNDGHRCDYYWLYNNVLFIALDNVQTSSTQREFVIRTLEAFQGKYQYCVVYKHYPDFTTSTSTGMDTGYGGYEKLRDVWDKYNVDVVISGDSHVYVRTKRLYNNAVYTGTENKGTVYFTTTNIYDGGVSVKSGANQWYEKVGNGAAAGAFLFEVTPTEMKFNLFNSTGVVDTYTFPARHDFVIREELKKDVEQNISYINLDGTGANATGYVVTTNTASSIVKNIKVYSGDTLVGEGNPLSTKIAAAKVTGLAKDSIVDLKAVITYSNNDTEEVMLKANTFAYSGFISRFEAKIQDSKINLTWIEKDLTSTVKGLKLYKDGTLLASLNKGTLNYSFQMAEGDADSTYTIALMGDGDIVLNKYECTVNSKGDINLDGVVDYKDLDMINAIIFGGDISDKSYKIADINADFVVDYKDIIYIWENIKHGESLQRETFTVTFKNIDGTVISTQKVAYGEAADAPKNPTLEGYNFSTWNDDYSFITGNCDIYAVYKK